MINNLEFWRHRCIEKSLEADPIIGTKKKFVKKISLPEITNYTETPNSSWWNKFPKNTTGKGASLISAIRLMSIALAVGVTDTARLHTVCNDIKFGAKIGCEGRFRLATVSKNSKNCMEFPQQITDAIACWVKDGFALGPFTAHDLPKNAKINSILCREKPNGAVRVILNLSAPLGSSVNDGIDTELFPTTMSSTGAWLECLNRAGPECQITKLDWANAYKHIHVSPDDIHLQYFEWLGMYFCELNLIFGSASSAGIYDRTAKTVLDIVLRLSRFPANMVCQYLDDICAAAQKTSKQLQHFVDTYRKVCAEIGVQLAPLDDPDKAFNPCTSGTVLGVFYDTVAWTWQIPNDKLARLISQIRTTLISDTLTQSEIWSLVGRIIHYCPLVPKGRFNINHLIRINSISKIKTFVVTIDARVKQQLYFWMTILKTTSGLASIPKTLFCPAWALECYTDAAGGSTVTGGLGCGGVADTWWFYVPWSRHINTGKKTADNKKLSRKMSALELVGPLICVAANYNKVRSSPVKIFVDNSGSVAIWKKGYSNSCQLCTTLCNAISDVSAGLGCTVFIEKTERCATQKARIADALSKGDFSKFKNIANENGYIYDLDPSWIPPSILAWIANPIVTDVLGTQILQDLCKRTPILGYNC